jgi:hypothetical protein
MLLCSIGSIDTVKRVSGEETHILSQLDTCQIHKLMKSLNSGPGNWHWRVGNWYWGWGAGMNWWDVGVRRLGLNLGAVGSKNLLAFISIKIAQKTQHMLFMGLQ